MEFINSKSINCKNMASNIVRCHIYIVFQSKVSCKPLFPIFRGKKVIIITKKSKLLEKYGKWVIKLIS